MPLPPGSTRNWSKANPGWCPVRPLKRSYRRRLVRDRTDVRLVYLQGSFELISERMQRRRDHFMPVSLLKTQFDILEAPAADENVLVVSIAQPAERVAETIIAALGLTVPGQTPARDDDERVHRIR